MNSPVGLHGRSAYEIGVLMAPGAMPSTIEKMIVSRGAGLGGIGRQSGSLPLKFAQMKEKE
jgi:hypothetical protein